MWDYLVCFDVQKGRFFDYFLEEQWTDLNRCQNMPMPTMPSPDPGFWNKYVKSWFLEQKTNFGEK